jgi:fatty acid desaturase
VPRHDVDGLSLLAGVIFVGVALVALLTQGAGLGSRWTWPALLIVAGVAGLLATRRDGDRNP